MEQDGQKQHLSALLSRLEDLSEKSGDVEDERQVVWQGIMDTLLITQDDLERLLVDRLGCQVITARRWITGKYTPRKLAISNLRRIWATGRKADELNEEMVDFMGSKIAIHTLSHFFSRLEHAKFCLCAKGWLGYKAGRHPGARDEMVRILTQHRDIEVHYVFSPDSEAQRTLVGFLQFLSDRKSAGDVAIIDQVHAWTTSTDSLNDGLRYNIASPFILVYSDEGAKHLGRSLDIWYELPVAAQSSIDGAAATGNVEHILVELPNHEALALWRVWRELFVEIIRDNDRRQQSEKWQDEAWRESLFHLLSLSNEYSGPGTSLESLQSRLKSQ